MKKFIFYALPALLVFTQSQAQTSSTADDSDARGSIIAEYAMYNAVHSSCKAQGFDYSQPLDEMRLKLIELKQLFIKLNLIEPDKLADFNKELNALKNRQMPASFVAKGLSLFNALSLSDKRLECEKYLEDIKKQPETIDAVASLMEMAAAMINGAEAQSQDSEDVKKPAK